MKIKNVFFVIVRMKINNVFLLLAFEKKDKKTHRARSDKNKKARL